MTPRPLFSDHQIFVSLVPHMKAYALKGLHEYKTGQNGGKFSATALEQYAATVLYGLEPRGLGGPSRKSLRGYLVRLAAEHALRPRDLVARVLVQPRPNTVWPSRNEPRRVPRTCCQRLEQRHSPGAAGASGC